MSNLRQRGTGAAPLEGVDSNDKPSKVLEISGWTDCKYYQKAVKHAEYVRDTLAREGQAPFVVHTLGHESMDAFWAWLSKERESIKAHPKHSSSPAVWWHEGGAVQWVGGFQ